MAQFYAEIQGARGMASRIGSKSSGISGHIRGWNVGVRVTIHHDEYGRDVVTVFRTSGSNGRYSSELIAEFTDKDRLDQ